MAELQAPTIIFFVARLARSKVNTFLSRIVTAREFVSALRNFCEVIRHLGSCALLAGGFTSDLKLFYLPRSCLHRDKEGWRGELFPLLNSGWGVRICQPPLGSCRLPLSSKVFPRSRKLRAMRGERGVEVCMKGGEKRDRFLVACAHGDPFSPNSNLVTSLLRR